MSATPVWASEDSVDDSQKGPLFWQRFESYKSGEYDPLTVPVSWYEPTTSVIGAGKNTISTGVPKRANSTIDESALHAALEYAGSQDSKALLISHNGVLQEEAYWDETDPDSFFNPQSMSKTVLALLIGIAIEQGHLTSVNEPVSTYLEHWKGDARGDITIKQLLQMSSGLAQISDSYDITLDNPAVYQFFGTDFAASVRDLPLADLPGTRWDYNNSESILLGVILEKATGKPYHQLLTEGLWKPLDLADATLYVDQPEGLPMFSCCIFSRPRDWLNIGVMILQEGQWQGKQVVPATWIREMLTPAETNPGYGYQIWLGDHAVSEKRPEPGYMNQPWSSEPFADPDTVVLRGFGYQRVWIMPSKGLVVVRAGTSWPSNWDNSRIPNVLYQGIDSDDQTPGMK